MAGSPDELRRFVILFEGRSGSTYLTEALASHSSIRAVGEKLVGFKDLGGARQLEWTRTFLTEPPRAQTRAIGFKTKLTDVLDHEGMSQLLRDVGAHIILLQRRNRVKLVISLLNSVRLFDATGSWNLYREEDRLPAVATDHATFDSWLTKVEHTNRELVGFVKGLALPTLSIYFEDLLLDARATVDRVCSFLDVPPEPVQGGSLKNTSDDLREAIVNFDELRARYVGTEYEPMFDEVLVPSAASRQGRDHGVGSRGEPE
ncbi:MAG: hypothetical protein ACYSU7_00620 [Planctomycetota bacterium]